MSQKNVPPLPCYNLDIHGLITIIFGISVTEKIGNQNVLYFPTSPNLRLCTTWGNRHTDHPAGRGVSFSGTTRKRAVKWLCGVWFW